MSVVARIKNEWKDPMVFKRQLLRTNIPNVGLPVHMLGQLR